MAAAASLTSSSRWHLLPDKIADRGPKRHPLAPLPLRHPRTRRERCSRTLRSVTDLHKATERWKAYHEPRENGTVRVMWPCELCLMTPLPAGSWTGASWGTRRPPPGSGRLPSPLHPMTRSQEKKGPQACLPLAGTYSRGRHLLGAPIWGTPLLRPRPIYFAPCHQLSASGAFSKSLLSSGI